MTEDVKQEHRDQAGCKPASAPIEEGFVCPTRRSGLCREGHGVSCKVSKLQKGSLCGYFFGGEGGVSEEALTLAWREMTSNLL